MTNARCEGNRESPKYDLCNIGRNKTAFDHVVTIAFTYIRDRHSTDDNKTISTNNRGTVIRELAVYYADWKGETGREVYYFWAANPPTHMNLKAAEAENIDVDVTKERFKDCMLHECFIKEQAEFKTTLVEILKSIPGMKN